MRNWINGPHFPEDSRIDIQEKISKNAKENINGQQIDFLLYLKNILMSCEWNEDGINNGIRESAKEVDIKIKDAFIALYWLLVGKNNGPRIVSIISELERSEVIDLFESISNVKS
jgi:lysyl-tRNA synthetase class I